MSSEIKFVQDQEQEMFFKWIKPRRATAHSAGYDFFAPFPICIPPHGEFTVNTHIKAKMPDNVVLMMYPRSGLGFKYGVRLANTVGVIDSDYYSDVPGKGVIKVKLVNPSDDIINIEEGKAYCQGIFMPFFTTDDDDATGDRDGDGFGSTDKK